MADKKTSVLLQAAIDEVNSNKEIKKQMERLVKQFSGKYRLDCPVRLDTGPALRQAEQLVTQINRMTVQTKPPDWSGFSRDLSNLRALTKEVSQTGQNMSASLDASLQRTMRSAKSLTDVLTSTNQPIERLSSPSGQTNITASGTGSLFKEIMYTSAANTGINYLFSRLLDHKNVGGTPRFVPYLHAPTAAGFLREPQVWTPQPV